MGKKGKRSSKQGSGEDKKITAAIKEVLGLCNRLLDVVKTEFPAHPSAQWEEYERIHAIIEEIRQKQKDDGIQWEGHCREAQILGFTKWFKENGGKADKVEVFHFGEKQGLGLKATADIKADDVFVTVPEKMMMSVKSAMNSELGPLIRRDRMLSSLQHATLALHILYEKLRGEASPWKPYLDILPIEHATALYFSPDDMKMLQGCTSFGDALKPYRSTAKHYAYLLKLFQAGSGAVELILRKSFTFDAFRWAVSTMMTRQNEVPVSDNLTMKALIPMWDMCNHCNGKITTALDTEEKACKSFALRSYKAGEQVLIYYGKRNNSDLLFNNGFVFPENDNDWVNIQLGVSRNDRLYAMKAQILAMVGLDASARPYQLMRSPNHLSRELRTFLRIFSMNDGELKIRLFNPERKPVAPLSELGNDEFTLSEENERKCWSFLHTRLQLILGQYKTTNKDDEASIRDENLSWNARNCIRLRMLEKETLASAMHYAKKRLESLDSKEVFAESSGRSEEVAEQDDANNASLDITRKEEETAVNGSLAETKEIDAVEGMVSAMGIESES